MRTLIAWLAALPTLLLAIEPLDLEMNVQDKKRTGIFKLSEKEKTALQGWIDNHYAKREEPLAAPAPKTPKPTLSENLNSGSYIRLSDDSLWNIRPEDTPITQGWISAVEIVITPSGDPKYPFKLTNSLTGSSVLARKATQVPGSSQTNTKSLTPSKK